MSHPIDVGSVLGGRYKVTATVLTSHDQDLVLDGVDQVLNRAVSILVAGPGNADQVAQSAREVATGERPGNVQILDLGVSEATTYLITNHTSAADLLDLVVSSNPPYVEPFFTDTLGSEIFGQPRSHEPETYDGLYDEEEVDAGYINYGQNQPRPAPGAAPAAQAASPARVPSRPGTVTGCGAAAAGAAGIAAGAAGAAAAASAKAKSPETAPQEATPQRNGAPARAGRHAPVPVQPSRGRRLPPSRPRSPCGPTTTTIQPADDDRQTSRPGRAPESAALAGSGSADRAAGIFPGSARNTTPRTMTSTTARMTNPGASRAPCAGWSAVCWPRSSWSAWFLLSPISAVSSRPHPQPDAGGGTTTSAPGATSAEPSATGSPAPAAGPPAIEGVTRLGDFDFAGTYDGDLVKTFDGNAASYWSDMEFATDNWGGLATEVPLVVKLESPAEVSSVTLSQLGASGGNISVFTNDRPSLDGAKQVGSNSFTSPDLTMPLQEPTTAQYVIVSIKSLPKLAAPKTRYGYGPASGRDQGPVGDP